MKEERGRREDGGREGGKVRDWVREREEEVGRGRNMGGRKAS